MYCKNCGYNNDPEASFCEKCGKSLGKHKSNLSQTNKILIICSIILIASIAISAGALLTNNTPKQPIINNSSNNTTSNQTQTVNQTIKNTSTKTSNDLEGYTLTDVRDATKGLNPDRCKYCNKWAVSRTVYEYHNSRGDRIMIGANFCNNCKRTFKDEWKNGVWFDI